MADTAITINSARVSPLSLESQASSGFNVKYRILYSDILYGTGSTDTVSVTLGATPTNWYVDHAQVNVSTAFAGTTALTLAVGTTTSTVAFVTAQSVLAKGQLEQASALPVLTNATATAAVNMVATFTNATGGSPSALTAGQADIFLRVVDVDQALV
jgi:hypothetical protein